MIDFFFCWKSGNKILSLWKDNRPLINETYPHQILTSYSCQNDVKIKPSDSCQDRFIFYGKFDYKMLLLWYKNRPHMNEHFCGQNFTWNSCQNDVKIESCRDSPIFDRKLTTKCGHSKGTIDSRKSKFLWPEFDFI